MRLVVTRIGRSVIEAKLLSGSFDGQTHVTLRIDMTSNEDEVALFYQALPISGPPGPSLLRDHGQQAARAVI